MKERYLIYREDSRPTHPVRNSCGKASGGNEASSPHLERRQDVAHQFHWQDLAKYMKAGRRATAAVTHLSLPCQYAVGMYNSAAGGIEQWCAHVRPPLYRAMRLGALRVGALRPRRRIKAPGHGR